MSWFWFRPTDDDVGTKKNVPPICLHGDPTKLLNLPNLCLVPTFSFTSGHNWPTRDPGEQCPRHRCTEILGFQKQRFRKFYRKAAWHWDRLSTSPELSYVVTRWHCALVLFLSFCVWDSATQPQFLKTLEDCCASLAAVQHGSSSPVEAIFSWMFKLLIAWPLHYIKRHYIS